MLDVYFKIDIAVKEEILDLDDQLYNHNSTDVLIKYNSIIIIQL